MKADLVEKLLEHAHTERFCQHVSQLLVSPNELHFGLAIVRVIPDEKPYVYVFTLAMMHWILVYQGNSGLVLVHP